MTMDFMVGGILKDERGYIVTLTTKGVRIGVRVSGVRVASGEWV